MLDYYIGNNIKDIRSWGIWVIGVLISGVLLICCRLIIISFALWLVIEAIGTF